MAPQSGGTATSTVTLQAVDDITSTCATPCGLLLTLMLWPCHTFPALHCITGTARLPAEARVTSAGSPSNELLTEQCAYRKPTALAATKARRTLAARQ